MWLGLKTVDARPEVQAVVLVSEQSDELQKPEPAAWALLCLLSSVSWASGTISGSQAPQLSHCSLPSPDLWASTGWKCLESTPGPCMGLPLLPLARVQGNWADPGVGPDHGRRP